jgi:hypothetical protein
VAPPRRAADGTRYAACKDGTCEVAVARKTRITFKDGTLSLSKIRAGDALNFRLKLSYGGSGKGTLKGTCGTVAYFALGGGVRVTTCDASGVPKRPKPFEGEVALQLVGWTADGAAVLRIVSG